MPEIKVDGHLQLNKANQLLGALLEIVAGNVGSAVEGQPWYDTTADVFKVQGPSGPLVGGCRLDQVTAPTADLSLNSRKIVSLADPASAQDAATKAYVDAAVVGLDLRESARVAAKTNITVATPGASIDGVSLSSGDRVLLTAQSTGGQNGLWVWNGAASAMTRPADFDTASDADAGILVPVGEGTNAGLYLHSTAGAITFGTTTLTFTDITPRAAGGTLTKFSATGPGSAGTTWAVAHNLGTKDVQVYLYEISTNRMVLAEVIHTDTNTVTINTNATMAQNGYRVVVIG